jgi:uncharacterized membrane protein
VRDIFVDYSPATLSLLLNHKIEDKKDFNSTILNLHAKKAIEFNRVNSKLEIVDLQNEKVIISLTEDEKYIYNVLTNKETFDKDKWYSIIQNQIDKRNFLKSNSKSAIWKIVKIYIILFAFVLILFLLFVFAVLLVPGDFFKNIASNHFDFHIILSIFWILILIPIQLGLLKLVILINKTKYLKDKMKYYTEKGALEVLKWSRFKSFIEDFSMLDNASVESVVLWEKYLAYAMACNINKSYNSDELKNINQIIKEINLFK